MRGRKRKQLGKEEEEWKEEEDEDGKKKKKNLVKAKVFDLYYSNELVVYKT